MSCENCHGSCGGCGALVLTAAELELLRHFGQTPFLPAASAYDMKIPVYLGPDPLSGGIQRRHFGLGRKGLDPSGLRYPFGELPLRSL